MDPARNLIPGRDRAGGRARPHRDQRGIIAGFVVGLVIVAMAAGLVMHEGGQILRAQVKAQSAARAAALEASRIFAASHDEGRASAMAARAAVAADGAAMITRIDYGPDGSATVTVAAPARTLVAQRVPFLRGFTTQRATEHQSFTR